MPLEGRILKISAHLRWNQEVIISKALHFEGVTFCRAPTCSYFVTLERTVHGLNFHNLTTVIVDALMTNNGLSKGDVAFGLVCFGATGVIVFLGREGNIEGDHATEGNTCSFLVQGSLCNPSDNPCYVKAYLSCFQFPKLKLYYNLSIFIIYGALSNTWRDAIW
jgi:hypothetical protein